MLCNLLLTKRNIDMIWYMHLYCSISENTRVYVYSLKHGKFIDIGTCDVAICGGSALDGSVPPRAVTSLGSGASRGPMDALHVIACLRSSETASHVTSPGTTRHSPRVEWPLQTKFNTPTRKDTSDTTRRPAESTTIVPPALTVSSVFEGNRVFLLLRSARSATLGYARVVSAQFGFRESGSHLAHRFGLTCVRSDGRSHSMTAFVVSNRIRIASRNCPNFIEESQLSKNRFCNLQFD